LKKKTLKTFITFIKHSYTGHTFRRTSATLLADSGADLLTLKRHGGWKSNTVAEGYVEDSVCQKKRIGQQIANAISEKPSTSRERPHHQINPNDQITTQSPIYKKKKTLKLKILTHVIIHKVLIFISPIARIFL
jgi:hypothetical protein